MFSWKTHATKLYAYCNRKLTLLLLLLLLLQMRISVAPKSHQTTSERNLYISLIFTSLISIRVCADWCIALETCQKSLIYEQSMWACVKHIKIVVRARQKYIRITFYPRKFIWARICRIRKKRCASRCAFFKNMLCDIIFHHLLKIKSYIISFRVSST